MDDKTNKEVPQDDLPEPFGRIADRVVERVKDSVVQDLLRRVDFLERRHNGAYGDFKKVKADLRRVEQHANSNSHEIGKLRKWRSDARATLFDLEAWAERHPGKDDGRKGYFNDAGAAFMAGLVVGGGVGGGVATLIWGGIIRGML